MGSMSLGHGWDADMSGNVNIGVGLGLDLGMDMDVDPSQIMHMHDHGNVLLADYHEMSSIPDDNVKETTKTTPTTTAKTAGSRQEPVSPPMFLVSEPSMLLDDAALYGSIDDVSTPSASYPSLYQVPLPLPLSQEPATTGTRLRDNSPPLTRSRVWPLSRDAHNSGMFVADHVLPSVESHESHGGFGLDYSHSNSNSNGHGHGRQCSDSSSNDSPGMDLISKSRESQQPQPDRDLDLDLDLDLPPRPPPHSTSNISVNINGPPPTDLADWRARLRYCEQAVHKASLDASLVRLLEFPEGLDAHELEARRAANLRFDRVREQRLKDRNNEAAKRSRQRKVRRIEDAEQRIEALKQDRAYLSGRVAFLEQQLAAAASAAAASAAASTAAAAAAAQGTGLSSVSLLERDSQTTHVKKTYKTCKTRRGSSGRCRKPQERRVSLGRNRATRARGSNNNTSNTGFQYDDDNDDDDDDDGNDGNDGDDSEYVASDDDGKDGGYNRDTITVGILV